MKHESWAAARYQVTRTDGSENVAIVKGRNRWALEKLMDAGPAGCTPIDQPGPRWSAYRFNLVHYYGVEIETRHEKHGPPFAGTHARYTLVSKVTRLPWATPAEADGGEA
jgi:hypothetical protein